MSYISQGVLGSFASVYSSYGLKRKNYQKMVNKKSYKEVSEENMKKTSDDLKKAMFIISLDFSLDEKVMNSNAR